MMELRHRTRDIVLGLILVPLLVGPSRALFHFAEIHEIMTSYGGDTTYQFVEIRMLAGSQQFVQNSVLGAFDASGTFLGDVLVVPGNVTNNGVNVRWLMASTAFNTANPGLADFVFTGPTFLPTTGGMVCWGAPGASVPAPGSWMHNVPNDYTDCVSYGTYSGPANTHTSAPTTLTAEGHSLRRVSDTNNSLTDFTCADPADPTNNAGTTVMLNATSGCPAASTPTATASATQTGTVTATATETPTITPTSSPLPGCPAAPATGCATPGKSLVRMKASGSKIVWKWLKGTATAPQFGDPVANSNGYHFCIYEDSALLTGTTIPGGTGWNTIGGGFKYKTTVPGITKATLKEGTLKAKVLVKGKEAPATVPALPLTPTTDLTVQLLNTGSADCWESVYPAANVSGDANKLRAQVP